MEPTEVDVSKIQYTDANGNPINGSGSGSGTGGGWLGGLLGAIPGILSALFPSGIGGGQQNPYVTTLPNGNTSVNLAGSNNNNLMMLALLGMVAYLVFTGKQPVKVKK